MTADGESDADRPEEAENAAADETAEAAEQSPEEDPAEPVDGDQADAPAEESAEEPSEDQEPEADAPEAEEGDDAQAEEPVEESAEEPSEGQEPEAEAPETEEAEGAQEEEPAAEPGEEQEPEGEAPEAEENAQAEAAEEAPEEEATADDAEPEADAEAEAPGEEAEPAPEPEIAVDELPESKRGGEEAEIDEGALGEQYELSEDVAGGAPAATAEELASDQAPGAEQIAIDQAELGDEPFEPSEVKGRSPTLIIIQVLLSVAVIGMGLVWWVNRNSQKASDEAEAPATLDYKYTTKTGTPERPIEETIAPLDLGEAKIKSIALAGDKKSQCEIVLNLPTVYWGSDELKTDAEKKAMAIVRAAFDGVVSLEEITFKAMGALDEEDLDKREVALQVVASRAAHAKADYSGGPASVLMLFKTTYHKSLQ